MGGGQLTYKNPLILWFGLGHYERAPPLRLQLEFDGRWCL